MTDRETEREREMVKYAINWIRRRVRACIYFPLSRSVTVSANKSWHPCRAHCCSALGASSTSDIYQPPGDVVVVVLFLIPRFVLVCFRLARGDGASMIYRRLQPVAPDAVIGSQILPVFIVSMSPPRTDRPAAKKGHARGRGYQVPLPWARARSWSSVQRSTPPPRNW